MSKILKVRNVNDYSRYVGCKEQHPLVSVIDYAEVSPVRHSLNDYGVNLLGYCRFTLAETSFTRRMHSVLFSVSP